MGCGAGSDGGPGLGGGDGVPRVQAGEVLPSPDHGDRPRLELHPEPGQEGPEGKPHQRGDRGGRHLSRV